MHKVGTLALLLLLLSALAVPIVNAGTVYPVFSYGRDVEYITYPDRVVENRPYPTHYNGTSGKWEKSKFQEVTNGVELTTQDFQFMFYNTSNPGFKAIPTKGGSNITIKPSTIQLWDPIGGYNVIATLNDTATAWTYNDYWKPYVRYHHLFQEVVDIGDNITWDPIYYFKDDGPQDTTDDLDPMDLSHPVGTLDDVDNDAQPGLTLVPSPNFNDPSERHTWTTGPLGGSLHIDGDVNVHLWVTPQGFPTFPPGPDVDVQIKAQLWNGSTLIATTYWDNVRWAGSFKDASITFPGIHEIIQSEFKVKIFAPSGGNEGDVWIAYNSSEYQSRVAIDGYLDTSTVNISTNLTDASINYYPNTASINKLVVINDANPPALWNFYGDGLDKDNSYFEIKFNVSWGGLIVTNGSIFNGTNPIITDKKIYFIDPTNRTELIIPIGSYRDAIKREYPIHYKIYPNIAGQTGIGLLIPFNLFEDVFFPIKIDPALMSVNFEHTNIQVALADIPLKDIYFKQASWNDTKVYNDTWDDVRPQIAGSEIGSYDWKDADNEILCNKSAFLGFNASYIWIQVYNETRSLIFDHKFQRNAVGIIQSTVGAFPKVGICLSPDGRYLFAGFSAYAVFPYLQNPPTLVRFDIVNKSTSFWPRYGFGAPTSLEWNGTISNYQIVMTNHSFITFFDNTTELFGNLNPVLLPRRIAQIKKSPDGKYLLMGVDASASSFSSWVYRYDLINGTHSPTGISGSQFDGVYVQDIAFHNDTVAVVLLSNQKAVQYNRLNETISWATNNTLGVDVGVNSLVPDISGNRIYFVNPSANLWNVWTYFPRPWATVNLTFNMSGPYIYIHVWNNTFQYCGDYNETDPTPVTGFPPLWDTLNLTVKDVALAVVVPKYTRTLVTYPLWGLLDRDPFNTSNPRGSSVFDYMNKTFCGTVNLNESWDGGGTIYTWAENQEYESIPNYYYAVVDRPPEAELFSNWTGIYENQTLNITGETWYYRFRTNRAISYYPRASETITGYLDNQDPNGTDYIVPVTIAPDSSTDLDNNIDYYVNFSMDINASLYESGRYHIYIDIFDGIYTTRIYYDPLGIGDYNVTIGLSNITVDIPPPGTVGPGDEITGTNGTQYFPVQIRIDNGTWENVSVGDENGTWYYEIPENASGSIWVEVRAWNNETSEWVYLDGFLLILRGAIPEEPPEEPDEGEEAEPPSGPSIEETARNVYYTILPGLLIIALIVVIYRLSKLRKDSKEDGDPQ